MPVSSENASTAPHYPWKNPNTRTAHMALPTSLNLSSPRSGQAGLFSTSGLLHLLFPLPKHCSSFFTWLVPLHVAGLSFSVVPMEYPPWPPPPILYPGLVFVSFLVHITVGHSVIWWLTKISVYFSHLSEEKCR